MRLEMQTGTTLESVGQENPALMDHIVVLQCPGALVLITRPMSVEEWTHHGKEKRTERRSSSNVVQLWYLRHLGVRSVNSFWRGISPIKGL